MDCPAPMLETERLALRPLTQADFDATCRLLQDPAVMYAYEGPFTREEVQAWLDKQLRRYREDGFGLWAVILKENGVQIGQCGITLQEYGDGRVPEVGYLLCKEYWHRGFATEAARACKEYAFRRLGFTEVYSIIRDSNLPSQRVAQRNGMVQVGTQVKHYKGVDMPHCVYRASVRLKEYSLSLSCPEVYAFSTTRHGGTSTGAYASLNCTPYTGDDPECVRRNRKILAEALPFPPRELVIPWQTHGTQVLPIDKDYLNSTPDERKALLQGIDALTTREPGFCLCISTADCIPLLLYDVRHRAVAAIHAGWRGTVAGIATHTLRHMHQLYGTAGEDVLACIGPGISRDAFEVGDEVYQAFCQAGLPMQHIAHRHAGTGKWHLDLPLTNRLQLLDFGVPDRQIEWCDICTYTRHEEFFSARRLGVKSGRMLTGIMIKG